MTRIVAADTLADRGIMAWEAGDSVEALAALAQHPLIGLVFTDVNLPGKMNGLDLAHHIRKVRPDVEFVITSGARQVALEELPDDSTFLSKPYATERLANILAEKLDDAKADQRS